MAQGRVSKALLLIALAGMALAQSAIAFEEVATGGHRSWVILNGKYFATGADIPATIVSPELDGWRAHPVAAPILLALAVLFIGNLNLGPTWMRFRYWVALAALIFCLFPSPGQTLILAVPTFVLALLAALFDRPARAVETKLAQ